MTFANSLDPDGQNVAPDLDPKLFDTLLVFLKEFFEKVDFEKKTADNNKSMKNYPGCKELKYIINIDLKLFCHLLVNQIKHLY